MHRRARHLNPKAAGAVCVLDARYITQADSTAVSTWSDRSGNAYDASQATSANQPVFLLNQKASNPAVDFVGGGTDFMEFSSFASLTDFSFISTAIVDVDDDVAIIEANNGTLRRGLTWGSTGTGKGPIVVYGDNKYKTTTSTQTGEWKVFQDDNSEAVRVNESSLTLSAENAGGAGTNNTRRLGRLALNFNAYLDGKIAQLFAFDVQLSNALRKRITHHSAFSYKIACS